MENAGLICSGLSIELGGMPIFEDVSFTLNFGNILLIKGENGAGKSTLLRILAGILRPDAGNIIFLGSPLEQLDDFGKKIAYIGHRLGLIPALTPREMVHLWAKLYDRRELIDVALHYFDLERYADMPCHTLSAGWQQKLALSRLIICPAKLWLLDEPASHLDREGSLLLQSLLTARKEQGGMIALAMHGGEGEAEGVSTLNLSDNIYEKQYKNEIF